MIEGDRGPGFWLHWAALIQSAYYILTGLWALLHIPSFIWVTGPKYDVWLVKTVGVLVLVIGCTLLIARIRRRYPLETVVLAIGTALGLTLIDVYYVLDGRISAIYLLDAVAELALAGMWTLGLIGTPAPRRPADS
jgi:hypothetical protein